MAVRAYEGAKNLLSFRRRMTGEEYMAAIVADTLDEVRVLGLSGKTFVVNEFADELAKFTGLHLPVGHFPSRENPLVAAKLRELRMVGAAIPQPSADTVYIAVPDGLTGLTYRHSAFHELVHVACAHEFEPRRCLDEEIAGWRPPKKLTSRESPETFEGREYEANLRASVLVRASIYGRKMSDRPEHFMGLGYSRFPRRASSLWSPMESTIRRFKLW